MWAEPFLDCRGVLEIVLRLEALTRELAGRLFPLPRVGCLVDVFDRRVFPPSTLF